MSFLLTTVLPALLVAAVPVQPPATPDTTVPSQAAAAPVVDPKAKSLLAENEKTMLALKSYSAECFTMRTFAANKRRPKGEIEYAQSTLVAVKPNLMRYEMVGMDKSAASTFTRSKYPPTIFAIDGKQAARQFGNRYRVDNQVAPKYAFTLLEPWGGFYTADASLSARFASSQQDDSIQELRYTGRESVEGVPCEVIAYKYKASTQAYDGKLFIGPDHLMRRQLETITFNGEPGFTSDAVLRRIKTNFASPRASAFAYTPAPGIKKEDTAELARQQAEADAKRPKLLANGTPAPDFTVEDLDGKAVKLSDYKGKTVILDFWATWCGPCMMAMPHTNAAGKKFKDHNVVVVAVNVWDTKDAYKAWVPKNQSKYDAVTFLLDPHGRVGDVAKTLYNVSGIPTQYVIDPQGIIRASFLGYDEDNPTALETAVTGASAPGGK